MRRLRKRYVLPLVVGGICWSVLAVHQTQSQRRPTEDAKIPDPMKAELPVLQRDDDYVSSRSCIECHPDEHASWHKTFHRTMTQVALPTNVAGKFDGTTTLCNGLPYSVSTEGDAYWATMPDPEIMMYVVQGSQRGMAKKIDEMTYLVKRTKDSPIEKLDLRDIPQVKRRVLMTTGSHHYQTYWVDGSAKFGRLLQTLPLVYLIKDQRWIPRDAAFLQPPGVNHMITQWNNHCIKCHSTGGVPGLDKQSGKFETRVAELGIACEACHGPGREHIREQQTAAAQAVAAHTVTSQPATIVNPNKLDHRKSSEICGQCHGVFVSRPEYAMKYAFEGILYRPGQDLDKTRYYIQHPINDASPARQTEQQNNPDFFRERWWNDGTMLAGGREYSAMSVSQCYQKGELSCLSCHSMHDSDPQDQLKDHMRTSHACTQCHDQSKYTTEVETHTFHASNSAGSECMNCHMPHTSYALLGAIRNHQITSPNVASSVIHGVPNACNLCHLDRTLDWTQDQLATWYGQEKHPLSQQQHDTSAALTWLLSGDAAQRIISAWHFGWEPAMLASGTDWLAPFQAQLLADPYGVVRYVAAENLKKLPDFEQFEYDFLASPDDLRRFVNNAVEKWHGSRSAVGKTGEHICIDETGHVIGPMLKRMLDNRDDRPVSIQE